MFDVIVWTLFFCFTIIVRIWLFQSQMNERFDKVESLLNKLRTQLREK